MKKLLKQFSIFAAVFAVAATFGVDAFASADYTAGESIEKDLIGNLEGTAGTTVGLLISLFGLYMWIWNQVTWGLMVAIGGGLITVYPSIFTNIEEGAAKALKETASGASSGK